jgi:carboxy-cis,cis-muconate cyclase
MKKWSSYTVKSPTDIIHHASHPMLHDRMFQGFVFKQLSDIFVARAASLDTNTRAIFVLAAKQAPFNVYGNPFYDHAGFGNVFSVDSEGGLEKNIQNYEYSPETGIHGMVFDPTEAYLYSADLRGNSIWTHKKDKDTGELTLVNRLKAPAPGDHPRWVAIHPSGNYLYVLMEAGNRLGVYVIDEQSHIPAFTHITYPLIPPGACSTPRTLNHH